MFDRKSYMKKYLKKYREKNRDTIQENNLKYKEEHKEELKVDRKKWAKKNSRRISSVVRANKLKTRYGLTPAEYDELAEKQMKKCAICGSEEKLHVDHCHQTKKVRGLLCGNCNRGLGIFKDDIERFKKAINYLLK